MAPARAVCWDPLATANGSVIEWQLLHQYKFASGCFSDSRCPRKSAAKLFCELASFSTCHVETYSSNKNRSFNYVLHVRFDVSE
jgi:hypothetical protein